MRHVSNLPYLGHGGCNDQSAMYPVNDVLESTKKFGFRLS